jgi:polar amino acid transport system substrate-binding protein
MRRVRVLAMLLGPLIVVSLSIPAPGPSGASSKSATPVSSVECTKIVRSEVIDKGHLTIATDNPVLAPWFEKNDPENHDGYEDTVAYNIAHVLGYTSKSVRWVVEPYAESYVAGPKKFDFDIDEIVSNSDLTTNVTLSSSYYDVQQSIIAMKSDEIVHKHSPAQLRGYRYGVIAHSPAATFVRTQIKPKVSVTVFASLVLAESALEAGVIDAIVIDTPTGNHAVTWDLVAANNTALATQVAQFPNTGDENYALLVQHGNVIVGCLNAAIQTLTKDGTIGRLKKKWLQVYLRVPVIRP